MSHDPVIALPLQIDSPLPEESIASPLPSERDLVERAKTDPVAFGELYEANYDRIINYIYRRTLDRVVAEELTSNTFVKALRALPKFQHHVPIQAWLYRIAGNEINAYYRTDKRRRQITQLFQNEFPMDQVCFHSPQYQEHEGAEEKMKQYAVLHRAISTLPEHYQAVLVLRYFEGLKLEEITQVLDKRIGTVKSLVHRGLARLRKIIPAEIATFSQ